MTMLEKAARALADLNGELEVFDEPHPSPITWRGKELIPASSLAADYTAKREHYFHSARAVLKAIREPSEGMTKAMLASVPEGHDPGPFAVAWYTMIDAALSEPLPVSSGDGPTEETRS